MKPQNPIVVGALITLLAAGAGSVGKAGAADPMTTVALLKKQALVVDKVARAAVEADVVAAAQVDTDARTAYEVADAALQAADAPAVGSPEHDALLTARFTAKVAWSAAGLAANDAAKIAQDEREATRAAETDFDLDVCAAVKGKAAAGVEAYCAKITPTVVAEEAVAPAPIEEAVVP